MDAPGFGVDLAGLLYEARTGRHDPEPIVPLAYLYDSAAKDVSRVTGIPWGYGRPSNTDHPRPFISLLDLNWGDRFRVAWTLIGMEYWLALRSTNDHGT